MMICSANAANAANSPAVPNRAFAQLIEVPSQDLLALLAPDTPSRPSPQFRSS